MNLGKKSKTGNIQECHSWRKNPTQILITVTKISGPQGATFGPFFENDKLDHFLKSYHQNHLLNILVDFKKSYSEQFRA